MDASNGMLVVRSITYVAHDGSRALITQPLHSSRGYQHA